MRKIILWSVAYLILPYFGAILYNRRDFRKQELLKVKCVFWISLQKFLQNFQCQE
jgi:hypothetical protein